ncbi:MAG: hypothetical protein ACRDDL_00920 [Sarcina sp.]
MCKFKENKNTNKFWGKFNINVGVISDEFLFNSYKDIANFIYITPENYNDFIGEIEILLVVTTWKGLKDEWKGVDKAHYNKRQVLYEIIEIYSTSGAKTIFYSKEDPVNYEVFKGIADKCQYILTSEENIINNYKTNCKNNNVKSIRFGVNPMYHNPIGINRKKVEKKILFSGSWYSKYEKRCNEMRMIFDGILENGYGLEIIDRNYNLNNDMFIFPKRYREFTRMAIEHSELQEFHKKFDFAINFNTVQDSDTMFANRIYELQALGNIIISNYSLGVENRFPNVHIINEKKDIGKILKSYDKEKIYKKQLIGIRNVMTGETTYERFLEICKFIGVKCEKRRNDIVVVVKEKSLIIEKMFNKQTYQNKILIEEKDLKILNEKDYKMISFWNEYNEYGEYYLEDMINGFKYTKADYITKSAYFKLDFFIENVEHEYIKNEKVNKYRSVFWLDKFEDVLNGEKYINTKEKIGYAIDRFEFVEDKFI